MYGLLIVTGRTDIPVCQIPPTSVVVFLIKQFEKKVIFIIGLMYYKIRLQRRNDHSI